MTTLPEELIILALDVEKGTVGRSSTTKEIITYALTAGILMELMLAERIRVEKPPKKFFTFKTPHGTVTVTDPTLTGDEILDDALTRIQSRGKIKGAFYWIDKLGPVTAARDSSLIDWSGKGSRFLARLAQQGVVIKKEHHTLGVISTPRFKLMDPSLRQELHERLDLSLAPGALPERRQVMLAALVRVCRLFGDLYPDGKRRHEAQDRAAALQQADIEVDFLCGEIQKVKASHDTAVYT